MDAGGGGVALDEAEDPSESARLRRHEASGHARWDERGGILSWVSRAR